ncbi:MAG: heme A synthase [Oscillochloris sp.]|nr:heme A synthase [Oscillochloris sp.]
MFRSRFAAFAWANVGYNLLVIMWGAFVRATGSGAGCGDHWPLCDGQVIPRAPSIEQMIEFSHRVTSGLALLGTVALLIWAFRKFDRGHVVRRAAVASMFFMLLEALVGAALVLFELVGTNTSLARAAILAVHLINTFLLIAALTLTAWWASGGKPIAFRGNRRMAWLLGIGLVGTALVGSSGGVTALGDTLLQHGALPGGIDQAITGSSHPLVQMRVIHPVLGILVGLYTLFIAQSVNAMRREPATRRLAWGVVALFFIQILLGGINVSLKAPVWMQMVHLLMADLVWICMVLLSALALAVPSETPAEEPVRRRAAAEPA